MKEIIEPMLNGMNLQGSLVEAGHWYAGQAPDHSVEIGLKVGEAVVSALTDIGIPVQTMIFVDDFHGNGVIEGVPDQLGPLFEKSGFHPDLVVSEKQLEAKAWELKAKLPNVKKSNKGTFMVSTAGLIYLERPDMFGKFQPTCNALDAALYLEKARMTQNGLLVTVLPSKYKYQQETTKILVKAAGCNAPILNVYFDSDGEITVDFDF